MSTSEFESLLAHYLEGTASAAQLARLRDALGASTLLRRRFQSAVRLHRAQCGYLVEHRIYHIVYLFLFH